MPLYSVRRELGRGTETVARQRVCTSPLDDGPVVSAAFVMDRFSIFVVYLTNMAVEAVQRDGTGRTATAPLTLILIAFKRSTKTKYVFAGVNHHAGFSPFSNSRLHAR